MHMTTDHASIPVTCGPAPGAGLGTDADWFDSLRGLLARQRETAGRLRQLVARQASLISAGFGEALLVLLGERQQAIDELLRSQAKLAPYLPEMSRRMQALPEAQQAEVRAALDEISSALDDVMRGDHRDQQAIASRRAGAREQLGSLNLARTARDAYVKPASQTNRFADQHG